MSTEKTVILDKTDVLVDYADAPQCDDCGEDVRVNLMEVHVFFRSAGVQHTLGKYCPSCAQTLAERIRDSLPEAVDE